LGPVRAPTLVPDPGRKKEKKYRYRWRPENRERLWPETVVQIALLGDFSKIGQLAEYSLAGTA